MCFPVNFAKFLRTPFLTEHLWWLLFKLVSSLVKFFFFVLVSECKSIYVSSNDTEHDNCGTTERTCRTVDQAIRLNISDNDTEPEIIIDGGYLQRNVYEVREHSIITNKSIIIKLDSKSNFIPLIMISTKDHICHDDDISTKAVFNIIY